MWDIGRAVENAQKQQCLALERTGFGIKTYETAHSHSLPLSKEKRVQGKNTKPLKPQILCAIIRSENFWEWSETLSKPLHGRPYLSIFWRTLCIAKHTILINFVHCYLSKTYFVQNSVARCCESELMVSCESEYGEIWDIQLWSSLLWKWVVRWVVVIVNVCNMEDSLAYIFTHVLLIIFFWKHWWTIHILNIDKVSKTSRNMAKTSTKESPGSEKQETGT